MIDVPAFAMAEIPSDVASSAAQAPIQSREVLKEQAARRANQAHAAARHVKTVDESGVIVETSDSDSRVFTDSEGSGSMGRNFADDKSTLDLTDDAEPGRPTDVDGQLHLDLEA